MSSTCLGCQDATRQTKHYLCNACWRRLAPETRRRLYRHDGQAPARLMQLYSAIRRAVPLEEIEVSA